MPAKRKSKKAGPAKKRRQPPPPDHDDDNNKNNKLSDQDMESVIKDLWKHAVVLAARDERQLALHRAVDETSALRRIVWPTLLRLVKSSRSSSSKKNKQRQDDSSIRRHASILVAHLMSWEHREGVNLDTALDFVQSSSASDEEDSSSSSSSSSSACWEMVCRTVVEGEQQQLQQESNNTDYDSLAVATHFFTIAWACVQQQQQQSVRDAATTATTAAAAAAAADTTMNKSSSAPFHELRPAVEQEVSSWDTWHYMPTRVRELLLRQESALDETVGKQKKSNRPPFVVTIVQHVLHMVEGDRLKLRSSLPDSDDQEDSSFKEEDNFRLAEWTFLHRALELLTDLISSQWETRRILIPYLDAMHFSVRCRMALGTSVASHAEENMLLAQQLLERLCKCQTFPINLVTGEPLSYVDVRSQYHRRAGILQKLCHRHYPEELPDVIYSGVGLLCQANTSFLREALGGFSDNNLLELLHKMRLVDKATTSGDVATLLHNREFLLQVLEHYLVIPYDPLEELQDFPLYPTERVLWDFARIPPSHYSLLPPSHVLSLPKLQTRFLSFADYLWRNFELMRLESAYEIRSDIVDVVRRIRPIVRQTQDLDNNEEAILKTEFSGWARMALELGGKLKITKVEKPSLGGLYPSKVLAEITLDLAPCGASIRREWDGLGEFDNLFLLGVDARRMTGQPAPSMSEFHRNHGVHRAWDTDKDRRVPDEDDRSFPERYGIILVRGCMVVHVRDEEGNILSDPSSTASPVGTKRTFLVAMDPTQYSMDARTPTGTDMYQCLNLVVRRHGRENNFKAVLETIRGLMAGTGSINRVIPSFLQQVLLGQGSPDSAYYTSESVRTYAKNAVGVEDPDSFLDYGDTFLDEAHLRSSFPTANVEIDSSAEEALSRTSRWNYRLRVIAGEKTTVEARPYPFLENFKGNQVPFTPVQVEAIRSGLSPGLSLIQGPPGTGKTDVAVQIIASLYHSFPSQRTVVITHSNAALNDIFEKVVSRGDIDEKCLLRLGAGERDLQVESTHDFTKTGRVAYCFQQRGILLEKVQQLSESLGLSGKAERGADGSPGYTCETAEYFCRQHIRRLVRGFERFVTENSLSESDDVQPETFPFTSYFKVLDKISVTQARRYFTGLEDLFRDLAVYRPFELLRSQRQRTDYLLMKQTRIVAMTCTHAAIARSHLVELGFEYDNVVFEEAGQMVEIEGFIPLLLQRGDADSVSSSSARRLKRVCLMGDHNQLPPVIKNLSFSKFSNLDQSLFTRLIRLGVPYTQLDKQGRARAEIASLYSWRYHNLGNLSHVIESDHFKVANAGFAHTMQLVNVDDFQGKGETSPTAYFYQNVGEAEFAVALFMYMVLIGHSPKTISILTTYNGQKSLIEDIISQRCGEGTPLAGIRPRAISTVDQYQGQQNDYILLSLVRTQSIGHLRDVRRLVVAVSRARRGLYVFCRQMLFDSAHELKRTFEQFSSRPSKLQLVLGENYPTERKVSDDVAEDKLLEVDDVSHLGSIVHQMQEEFLSQMSES